MGSDHSQDNRIQQFLQTTTIHVDGAINIAYYLGEWNASTNTPTLTAPQVGVTTGNYYIVSVQGTQNIGPDGSIVWNVGDYARYNGAGWVNETPPVVVTSVNGKTGNVWFLTAVSCFFLAPSCSRYSTLSITSEVGFRLMA